MKKKTILSRNSLMIKGIYEKLFWEIVASRFNEQGKYKNKQR